MSERLIPERFLNIFADVHWKTNYYALQPSTTEKTYLTYKKAIIAEYKKLGQVHTLIVSTIYEQNVDNKWTSYKAWVSGKVVPIFLEMSEVDTWFAKNITQKTGLVSTHTTLVDFTSSTGRVAPMNTEELEKYKKLFKNAFYKEFLLDIANYNKTLTQSAMPKVRTVGPQVDTSILQVPANKGLVTFVKFLVNYKAAQTKATTYNQLALSYLSRQNSGDPKTEFSLHTTSDDLVIFDLLLLLASKMDTVFTKDSTITQDEQIAVVLSSIISTNKYKLYLADPTAKPRAQNVALSDSTNTQASQTPQTILKSLQAEVNKADLDGSKKALQTIETLLQQYPASGGPTNAKLNKELLKLKNHYTYMVRVKEEALATNPAQTGPKANTKKPEEKLPATVKPATTEYNKVNGVEAKITKDRGVSSPPISQAVTVDFYEEDEPIEVQPATARIILKDPLTDTPNLDYPTNLIDTDLNDFRRAQLVLPYSVGEGSAKLSWFKLSTNPAVSGITEQSTGGPTLENIFGNNASYNQFFLKGLEESRNEKFQLVDTPAQGQTLFSFGEKPEFWTIRGQLLNDSINDWTNKFRVAWINHMRLNQLTRTGRYMEVHIPAIRLMFTCYPVALSLSHADESETVTNFAMMVFKRSEKVLPNLSYTKQDAKAAMLNTLLSLDNKSVLLEVPTKGNLTPIDPATGKPFANSSAEPTTSKEATTRTDRATRGGESGADGSGKVFPPRPPQEQLAPFQKKLDNRRS